MDTRIAVEFVDMFPMVLNAGTVYVSRKYNTSAHRCMCGCGLETVTPFDREGWVLKENEKHGVISIEPSILNTACPNKAHYYIRNNNVEWCKVEGGGE